MKNDKEKELPGDMSAKETPRNSSETGAGTGPDYAPPNDPSFQADFEAGQIFLNNLQSLVGQYPAMLDLTGKMLAELQNPTGPQGNISPNRMQELFGQVDVLARKLVLADDTIDELIAKLKGNDPQIRAQAARQLGERADTRAVEPLIAALDDPDYIVRYMVPSILGKLGDVRVIKPLIGVLRDDEINIRNGGRLALKNFGKEAVPDLLEALQDPDPNLRYTIIDLLGEIRDSRALPVLNEITQNDEGMDQYGRKVKDAAARTIRSIQPPARKKRLKKASRKNKSETPKFDWEPLLQDWSMALLASNDLNEEPSQEAIDSQWLGLPGATEEEILKAEERLGVKLPPSYREFLKVTNGWGQITTFIWKMWPVEEVEWFKVRNEDWIIAWTGETFEVPDEEYFTYGENQGELRTDYLKTALEISDTGDSCIFLLNPQVVTPEGEWEAWFFANWLPGARRYRSFWEMMQDEYQSFVQLQNDDQA